ncbi:hypothetical protein SBV1_1150018 [Verrucomicrobia bacterium]|nr:hypothetical protein SBV1_1150018 [Verrucomicrobiota bacterium]
MVEAGSERISAKAPATAGWDKFSTTELGTVEIKQSGNLVVSVRAKDSATWKAINLNALRFTPVAQ